MYKEMNEQLEQLRQGVARLRKTESMLRQLESQRNALLQKTSTLRAALDKENLDVDRLKGHSLAALFYAVLGDLDERRETERREALAAQLKYDQTMRDLTDIQVRIRTLGAERESYRTYPGVYEALLQQKQEMMLRENGEDARQLCAMTEKLQFARIRVREIREAIDAGHAVRGSLDRVLDSLSRAEDWGTWDMLGGGALSGYAKHSHIDDAKAEIEHTQRLLRSFHSELADVQIRGAIELDISDFARFADLFFDGLLVDWYVQDKIGAAQSNVQRVREQVSGVLGQLERMEQDESANLYRSETTLREKIEQAS